jgi:uncharacterized protein (DUF1684 family)
MLKLSNKFTPILLGALLILSACGPQEDPKYRAEIANHRAALNEQFFDAERSPLDSASFYTWQGLKFFPIQEKYKVKAILTPISNSPVFELPHSHQKTKPYKQYGKLKFELEGKAFELLVLEQEIKKPGYENYLIVPFTDETTGKETYGAGRYLDLEKSDAKEVWLDFNLAYNPYCAYNEAYTCPIPPKENNLSLRIEAGMKYISTEHTFEK